MSGLLAVLRQIPTVKLVQRNYHYRLADTSNDYSYQQGKLWNVYGDGVPAAIGPTVSAYGTGVEKAWANGHLGSSDVYVAVLDTGVDATHPDLIDNLDLQDAHDYIRSAGNPIEAPFVNQDEMGHGTHIAGIIGAVGHNQIGIAGINWHVKIIPLKVAAGNGKVDTAKASKALEDLIELKRKGKNIIAANLSWDAYPDPDGGEPDLKLSRDIKAAGEAGILCVIAAMNAAPGQLGSDNDVKPAYPANFDTATNDDGMPAASFDSVITVAALGTDGNLAKFSNYGRHSVHIAAPGVSIISTVPARNRFFDLGYPKITSPDGSTYTSLEGTSMAAPHVTGAAALYLASHPGASAQQVREAILHAVKAVNALKNKVATGGRLDLSNF